MIDIIGFAICGIIIFFAGQKLSHYGDLISSLSGLGRAWIGLILMASITSLPELMVGISSSAIIESADLAVGDILGSCALNLGILAMMDAFVPNRKPIFGTASQNHVIAAAMGIVLIVMAGAGIFLPEDYMIVGGLGLISFSFIVIYFGSIFLIYRFDLKQKVAEAVKHEAKEGMSLSKVVLHFSGYAIVIVGAALMLPHFTDNIATMAGLDKSFAGTLLLAVATSLPEIAVSIAAVRLGAVDMAVGNLLGSNLFNILILAIDDIFYTKGNLLKDASDMNLISCLATVLMAAIAIIGLSYRLEAKRFWLAWDALLIFSIYIANMVILYNLTS